MPRFYLTTPPKSVTYVLNLLCYLCSEPAPRAGLALKERSTRLHYATARQANEGLLLMLIIVIESEDRD